MSSLSFKSESTTRDSFKSYLPSLEELNAIAAQQREKTKALYGKEFQDKITSLISDGMRQGAAYFYDRDSIGSFFFTIPHKEVIPDNGLCESSLRQYAFEHEELRKCLEPIPCLYGITVDTGDYDCTHVKIDLDKSGETLYMVLKRGRWIQDPNF